MTFCREHKVIDSPGYDGVSCEVTEITDLSSKWARVMYYWGIVKGWATGDSNAQKLRLSRMASYMDGESCAPYTKSRMKEWVDEALAKYPSVPAAANFKIYKVVPDKGLQKLIAFDGIVKEPDGGRLKLKKVSSNTSITG